MVDKLGRRILPTSHFSRERKGEALKEALDVLPPNIEPIILTQHMPERFTKTFADRLNSLCRIAVKEEDGDCVLPGHTWYAEGSH